jgi:hypothetical protein
MIFFMIEHRYNGRLLDPRAHLLGLEWYSYALKFSTREEAHSWLKDTALIPEHLKWGYFNITKFEEYTGLIKHSDHR